MNEKSRQKRFDAKREKRKRDTGVKKVDGKGTSDGKADRVHPGWVPPFFLWPVSCKEVRTCIIVLPWRQFRGFAANCNSVESTSKKTTNDQARGPWTLAKECHDVLSLALRPHSSSTAEPGVPSHPNTGGTQSAEILTGQCPTGV